MNINYSSAGQNWPTYSSITQSLHQSKSYLFTAQCQTGEKEVTTTCEAGPEAGFCFREEGTGFPGTILSVEPLESASVGTCYYSFQDDTIPIAVSSISCRARVRSCVAGKNLFYTDFIIFWDT